MNLTVTDSMLAKLDQQESDYKLQSSNDSSSEGEDVSPT